VSVRVAICCAALLLAYGAPSPGQVVSDGQSGNLPEFGSGSPANVGQTPAAGPGPLVCPPATSAASTAALGQEGTDSQGKQEASAQERVQSLPSLKNPGFCGPARRGGC
jgi:hypothetical protein